jgi:nanoRNase/pAp phosphatase (c-di-AMP/oligoRNAs hydrolase)
LLDSEIETGRALFEAHEESVRQATFQCVAYDIETSSTANYRIFVFQEQAAGFKLTSDVAEWFRKNLSAADCPDVVAGWFYIVDKLGEDPHLVYSLRSVTDLVDVSKFAKANGGGGHTKAAGFSLRPGGEEGMDPYNYVQLAFEEFLTVEEAQHAK